MDIIYCVIVEKTCYISYEDYYKASLDENKDNEYYQDILKQNEDYINSQMEMQNKVYKNVAYTEHEKLMNLINKYNIEEQKTESSIKSSL